MKSNNGKAKKQEMSNGDVDLIYQLTQAHRFAMDSFAEGSERLREILCQPDPQRTREQMGLEVIMAARFKVLDNFFYVCLSPSLEINVGNGIFSLNLSEYHQSLSDEDKRYVSDVYKSEILRLATHMRKISRQKS